MSESENVATAYSLSKGRADGLYVGLAPASSTRNVVQATGGNFTPLTLRRNAAGSTEPTLIIGNEGAGTLGYFGADGMLYCARDTDASNFFVSGAGNTSTTGTSNLGMGSGALAGLTTGYEKIGIGNQALQDTQDGYNNVAVGYIAGSNITSGYYNFALGRGALFTCATGVYNVAIGGDALYNATQSNNVAIGMNVGRYLSSGSNNVLIGSRAGYGNGVNYTGGNNTIVGFQAAHNLATTANSNVFLGYQAGWPVTNDSNRLYICNSNTTTPIIYGEMPNTLLRFHAPTTVRVDDAATNSVTTALTVTHDTSGVPAAGLGVGLDFQTESSTTENTSIAKLTAKYTDITHASRKTQVDLYSTDSAAARVFLSGGANGTAPLLGFYGTAPVVRPSGYTTFTNLSVDRTCDADTVLVAELADIVGTLIEDLKSQGLIAA